ncbi:MAG: hypothetical protein ACP5P3_07505 [Ignavibacteria bacterium]
MKKSVTVFLIFSFFIVPLVKGQELSIPSGTGRYEALGFNPFMVDPAFDLNRNPSYGYMYRNYVFGDIGRADNSEPNIYKLRNQYIGVNFGLGKSVYLGFIVNKNEGRMFDSVFYVNKPWGMGSLGMEMPVVPVKAFVGIAPTEKFSLAISGYFARKSADSSKPFLNIQQLDTTNQGIGNWFEYFRHTQIGNSMEYKSSVIGVNLGTLGRFKDGYVEATIDFKFNNYSYKNNYDTVLTTRYHRWAQPPQLSDSTSTVNVRSISLSVENDGMMEFNGFTRAFITANRENQIYVVPYFQIGFFSWKPKYTPTDSKNDTLPKRPYINTITHDYDYSYFNLQTGVGINMPVFEKGLLACGLSFGYNSFKVTSTDIDTRFTGNGIAPGSNDTVKTTSTTTENFKYSRIQFPKLNLGLEWSFTSWLTGRIGYSRSLLSDKVDYSNQTTITQVQISAVPTFNNRVLSSVINDNSTNVYSALLPSDPIQTISLGLGFHFDRFSIDGMIGEKFFQKGPNILSGQDDKELFGVLSASYNFNFK